MQTSNQSRYHRVVAAELPTSLETPRSTARRRRTQTDRVAESSKRLLLAAAELTAEQGFEKTTASEIGQRAGYSRAMVRDRYGSKEALIEALFAEELEPRVNAGQCEGLDGLARVVHQIEALEDLAREDETLARSFFVLTFETAGPIQSLRPWYRGYFARYETLMTESLALGERDGSICPGLDHAAEARHFISHALGLAFRWTLDWDGFDYLGELAAWRAWTMARYAPVLG
jgi:AcrR family transcriptional regulator